MTPWHAILNRVAPSHLWNWFTVPPRSYRKCIFLRACCSIFNPFLRAASIYFDSEGTGMYAMTSMSHMGRSWWPRNHRAWWRHHRQEASAMNYANVTWPSSHKTVTRWFQGKGGVSPLSTSWLVCTVAWSMKNLIQQLWTSEGTGNQLRTRADVGAHWCPIRIYVIAQPLEGWNWET